MKQDLPFPLFGQTGNCGLFNEFREIREIRGGCGPVLNPEDQ
jgi:hypothetical protein